jgi:AcrR family transcriptional regulator
MRVNRRTQRERTDATRAALVAAGRKLFASHGYAHVSAEALVRAAGLSRGALYHQFGGKRELFAAVLEAVEQETVERIAQLLAGVADAREALIAGVDAWLEACADPEVEQIVLVDGPSVLGWEEFRALSMRHGLGVVEAVLGAAVEGGFLPAQPLRPLAHVLGGALDEAALYVARAEDQVAARAEMSRVLRDLVSALLSRGG